MKMLKNSFKLFYLFFFLIAEIKAYDEWNDIACDEEHHPETCDLTKNELHTVDDFDRCGPAQLPLLARNYYLAAAGRRQTYKDNKDAFRRINILNKALRDISVNDMKTNVLGTTVDFPIGHSPVGVQTLANPEGELATVAGLSSMKTIMVMSSFANTRMEEVAKKAAGTRLTLWMQTYIFQNRSLTVEIVRKAERLGFKGIVVTSDSNVDATVSCDARGKLAGSITLPNLGNGAYSVPLESATFESIKWLKSITRLPIILKGILTGEDATLGIRAGASAIFVSNHGGRQLDGSPATIDALPSVVQAVNRFHPRRDVYLDGGVRSGTDVYKAIARGAKMVFVGRPIIWGLAVNGSFGVEKVMTILKNQFRETMLLAGSTNPSLIKRNSLKPELPNYECRTVEL